MPQYEFQCNSCGLNFKKTIAYERAKSIDFTVKCSCGVLVKRKMTAPNYQFSMKPTSMQPQNTGVYSFDTNVDRVIGSDSQEKWKLIQKRQKEKRMLLQNNPDKSGYDIRRRLDNHYEISKSEERQAYDKGMSIPEKIKNRGKKL